MTTSAEDIARWMLAEVQREEMLSQEIAVYSIIERFGERFSYINDNGNPAIGKDVLKAFKRLSGETVVWERGERMWRLRLKHDDPGRSQY